jgi:hypothetical protein
MNNRHGWWPRWVIVLIGWLFLTQLPASAQEIALPHYEGYISVAPGGHYFVDEGGQGFIVIGQNDGVSWPGLVTLVDRSSSLSTERYIMDLREHGVTVSRIMIEYSEKPFTFLENPVGTFSPSIIQFWDDFFALAEAHGLYLLLTPYDTFWQGRHWDTYPYNATVGGPCETPHDWLTGAACIEAQKTRWRFILDRWGGSPNIFAWDILNEVDIWWEASPDEIETYVTDMATFIREYEMARWGRAHMLTVSSSAPIPGGVLADIIYRHPLLDFANTHLYINAATNDPENTIGAAPAVAYAVAESLEAIDDQRPYFDSETGPIDGWIGEPVVDAEYHHNMTWAHLMAGGAGSGMRWPYTFPHWILPELRDNLLGLARFASTVDWANFAPRNINSEININQSNIISVGCSDGEQALIWLLVDSRDESPPSLPGTTVSLEKVLADGNYTVEFWETYAGNLLEQVETEVRDGLSSITIPEGAADLRDLALIIRRSE